MVVGSRTSYTVPKYARPDGPPLVRRSEGKDSVLASEDGRVLEGLSWRPEHGARPDKKLAITDWIRKWQRDEQHTVPLI